MANKLDMGYMPAVALASAGEALLLTVVIPQHLPPNPFLWTLTRTFAFNFGLYLIYLCYVYPYLTSSLRKLPRPKGGYFFLNHGHVVLTRPPGNEFKRWAKSVPNDGMIRFLGFANQERILLTGPQQLAEVLVHKTYDFVKPKPVRDFLRGILGNGLIITEGEEHKFQRKHIMPVFAFRHIKELYPMMYQKAVQLAEGVEQQIKDNPSYNSEKGVTGAVEINHWANMVTMDIIGLAGLGKEFLTMKKAENDQHPLIQNYEEILEPTIEKNLFFLARIILPKAIVERLPWGLNERFRILTTNLASICGDLVREKRELLAKGEGDHFDILSVLIKSNNFSDKELVDQMLTFLAAGHETTSSAFTWSTFLLSTHKDVQERLRAELREHLTPDLLNDSTNLAQTLESLPLLNAICNETIRLYPTVPVTVRIAARPTTISNIFIPKNTQLILCPWATNRDPNLWGPDADSFRPERWIDPETGRANNTGGAQSNYAQLTFLHGPRSCIGKDFAKAELRCLVAAFVSKFDVELGMDIKNVVPGGVITSKPKDGMMLKLRVLEE